MRLSYDPETDSLTNHMVERPGIDVQHASQHADITRLLVSRKNAVGRQHFADAASSGVDATGERVGKVFPTYGPGEPQECRRSATLCRHSIDMQHASQHADITKLMVSRLPFHALEAA